MKRIRRPSAQTAAVLSALAQEPDRWRYGYDLCVELGMQAGSMYPILIRLADRALLETSWETEHEPGRPPRHLYRLTGTGREYAAEAASVAAQSGVAMPGHQGAQGRGAPQSGSAGGNKAEPSGSAGGSKAEPSARPSAGRKGIAAAGEATIAAARKGLTAAGEAAQQGWTVVNGQTRWDGA